jgi:hypothetical protein
MLHANHEDTIGSEIPRQERRHSCTYAHPDLMAIRVIVLSGTVAYAGSDKDPLKPRAG